MQGAHKASIKDDAEFWMMHSASFAAGTGFSQDACGWVYILVH